ncbi:MAG: DNA-binding protein, partial [Deltaproteobacteria bacterium]|nr:DNA-binding protein [Deltaproteobacteria bacterium]
REQGLLLAKGNPKGINGIADLGKSRMTIVNRPEGTGTRLLLDGELQKAGINGEDIDGYAFEFQRHLDVGLEILANRADAGMGIRAVAGLLDLDFIPLRWERFDLIVRKDRFFDQGVQLFLGILRNPEFQITVSGLTGYDLSHSGEMVFPQE